MLNFPIKSYEYLDQDVPKNRSEKRILSENFINWEIFKEWLKVCPNFICFVIWKGFDKCCKYLLGKIKTGEQYRLFRSIVSKLFRRQMYEVYSHTCTFTWQDIRENQKKISSIFKYTSSNTRNHHCKVIANKPRSRAARAWGDAGSRGRRAAWSSVRAVRRRTWWARCATSARCQSRDCRDVASRSTSIESQRAGSKHK